METQEILVLRDNAKNGLLQIKTIDAGLRHLNKLKSIGIWVRAEKKDAELQNIVAEQKLRTQRILGQLLKESGEIRGGNHGNQYEVAKSIDKTLPDGVHKNQSHTWQQIASIPEQKFEEFIQDKKAAVDRAVAELTTAGALRLAKELMDETKKTEKVYTSKGLPDGIYDVIYCDPPWQYSNSGFEMSAENHYPTMSTDQLCELKISELSATNSICFMWVTNPLLEDGLRVLKQWDFEYKTNFVWTKDKHTAGFYVYGQHELLLIGVKGSMIPVGEKFKSIITGNNDIHSKKPEITYTIIEKMFPGFKYLELFARNTKDNWKAWGNEL